MKRYLELVYFYCLAVYCGVIRTFDTTSQNGHRRGLRGIIDNIYLLEDLQ